MNPGEFMDKLDKMSDEELKSWLEKTKLEEARRRKKRESLNAYLSQEHRVYA